MSYAVLMVQLELGQANAGVFDAHVVGVAAERLIETADGVDADQLQRIAHYHGADMIVAGAYGHSRMREWALGGVTRDLLMRDDRPALVSH